MRPACLLITRLGRPIQPCVHRRNLLTLAIETSCDDTSVAVLETHPKESRVSARLHFHEKITSDNQQYGGVHPIVAHESHQKSLATLIEKALHKFPISYGTGKTGQFSPVRNTFHLEKGRSKDANRRKPDFITVTRGPGMRANLITGMDTAKGLAVAWQIPLLGVNHMQAHALTPRLVAALRRNADERVPDVDFPFLTLLVSGGHTMLVHSKGLCEHEILANTADIAIGDMIDKCARLILPEDVLKDAGNVMYGPKLEQFAFPKSDLHAYEDDESNINPFPLTPPLQNHTPHEAKKYDAMFSFSGIGSAVKRFVEHKPSMPKAERQQLTKQMMRVAFEHLASRIILALKAPELAGLKTLVVSGGVASNKYLKHVIRRVLDVNGHIKMDLVFPPVEYCTDNAAMIAWTGVEMWEAGYRTSLDAMALRKWAIDPNAKDGGILGADGWFRVDLEQTEAYHTSGRQEFVWQHLAPFKVG
jgi:N6-L-threonylcarbamoyladenine synthase